MQRHRSYGRGDMKLSISCVTPRHHEIIGSCDIMSELLTSKVIALLRLVITGRLEYKILSF